MDKSKIVRPKFRLTEGIPAPPDAGSVLELITPTARTFMCRRNGRLVDGGYCAFFCEIGRQQGISFNPNEGIEVFCPFAFNELLGHMGDGAPVDS